MTDQDLLAERFEEQRPRLQRLARRMLGSEAEADDAVQEAWLRLSRSGGEEIENLGGWLTTVTSRVCLNLLRTRAMRGETALDEQLPDPIVESIAVDGDPDASAQLSDAVETALLLVLDTLSPAERVAFVLHDTFDVPFEQIGELLERSPEATRQLASRARRRVRGQGETSDASSTSSGRRLVDAFFAAARDGDFDGLVAILAPDATLRVDDGVSATVIVRGAPGIASRAMMFANPGALLRPVLVDGRPGVLVTVEGRPVSLMGFRVDAGRVLGIDAYSGERLAGIRLP